MCILTTSHPAYSNMTAGRTSHSSGRASNDVLPGLCSAPARRAMLWRDRSLAVYLGHGQ
ncbi:unnamed protein product [Staurois parvus]|uniref:Uncharacterized protein n=1 Tax=Staurois parvus TaxID=386267 RepID=A0ABN9BC18_9NEOB|nr:unnamed protein product [Staurois parvus]